MIICFLISQEPVTNLLKYYMDRLQEQNGLTDAVESRQLFTQEEYSKIFVFLT